MTGLFLLLVVPFTLVVILPANKQLERRELDLRSEEAGRRAIAAKRDADIDFSDAPPVLDWSGAEIGKFYRPKKKPVTMRLDSDVIAWLKADGRGYQTKANWLLRNAMLHFTKEAGISRRRGTPRHGKAREGKGKG